MKFHLSNLFFVRFLLALSPSLAAVTIKNSWQIISSPMAKQTRRIRWLLFLFCATLSFFPKAKAQKNYQARLDTLTIGTDTYFRAYEDWLNTSKYTNKLNVDSLATELIKIAKQFNRPKYEAIGLYIKAQMLENDKKYDVSLQLLQAAIAISKSIKDHASSAEILGYMGVVYAEATKEYDKGIPFIEESNVICRKHNLDEQLSFNYYYMGYFYTALYEEKSPNPELQKNAKSQNYLLKATESFDKALKIAKTNKNQGLVDEILKLKVNLLLNLKDYRATIKLASTLLKQAQLEEDKFGIYQMRIPLAKAEFHSNNNVIAYEHINTAIQIIKELGFLNELINAYRVKHELALYDGDYKTALDYYVKHKEIKDSLWTTEKKLAFDELNVTYETAKKEKENLVLSNEKKALETRNKWISLTAILSFLGLSIIAFFFYKIRRQNTLIDQQKNTLNQSLQEKESLLKEIHHRVKNNLQIISNLMAKQARKTTDSTVKKMMKEGQDRVQSMALIHQNLYQSEHLSSIDIKAYLEELTQNIAKTQKIAGKEVTIVLNTDDSKLDIDTAIPIGLILNELITNAYKYAFPERDTGEIAISFQKTTEKGFQLHVKDNGIGISNDFNIDKAKSLGLNLVRGLAEQLDGTMKLVGSNRGTQFELIF